MARSAVVVGASILAGFIANSAQAANDAHPRTPVVWKDVPCMHVVDRSIDPVVTLEYDIPYEDLDVTEDEVSDSRTHQFFAFCRPYDPATFLPGWVSTRDVSAAAQKNLVDPRALDAEDVLETSTVWQGCWARITADEDRRPISFEMAAMPVVWNTTGLAPGTYGVHGYTHEPRLNLWTPRTGGVVRVHDGDSGAIGPGGALPGTERSAYAGDVVPIDGCVDGLPGTTVIAELAILDENGLRAWMPYTEPVVLEGETFSVPFEMPRQAEGLRVAVRARFEDPLGRSDVAYRRAFIVVLEGERPQGGTDTGAGEETGDEASGSTGVDTGAAASGERGCGCRVPQPLRSGGPGAGWILPVLVGWSARVQRARRTRLRPAAQGASTISAAQGGTMPTVTAHPR